MLFCGREDVDAENKSTVLRYHHGKNGSVSRLHSQFTARTIKRNYGNLIFAVFGLGFKREQFPPSPLTSAKLCRPLAKEATFLASFADHVSHMVKSLEDH